MTSHRNDHLTAFEIEQYADGERETLRDDAAAHLHECSVCASGVLSAMEMKNALRSMPRFAPPPTLRARVLRPQRPSPLPWLLAAAAVLALAIAGAALLRSRATAAIELVDLHNTLLASANPVEVLSTDRHTVKPWFEGRLPFAVDVPDLSATPFRLIGGRVIYWHGQPGAYLLISKGPHRISLFTFRSDAVPLSGSSGLGVTVLVWRANGVAQFAVADIAPEDLKPLQRAFGGD